MPRLPAPPPRTSWLRIARYAFVAALLLCLLFGYQIVRLYTDWQWFQEMQRTNVFSTSLITRLQLFSGLGVVFFLIFYFNLWLAQRIVGDRPRTLRMDVEREQFALMARRLMRTLSIAGAIVLAFLVAGNAATHWSEYLLFTHAGSFGQIDPVFGNDIGFYVFRLPFMSYLQGWLLFTLAASAIGTALIYYGDRAIDMIVSPAPGTALYVRRHLLALLGMCAIVWGWGFLLGRYDLLYSDNGAFFGAGYTDLHARLPAQNIQAILLFIVGLLCFVNIGYGRPYLLPAGGLVVWAAAALILGGAWPGFMQRFTVVPNQLAKERDYLARDIQFTRQAYGLTNVKEQEFSGTTAVTPAALKADQATIDNIRLWDWPQLGAVYNATQAFATFYRFTLPPSATTNESDYNIDVDRYRLGGQYRQVMLGARELAPEGLPAEAKTWQNQRLQYTHGYGVVMSPVNRVDSEGQPEYLLSEIPVKAARPELKLDRPELYYGEQTEEYVFVDTKQSEFDYPLGKGSKETRYAGRGGVPLGGTLSRFAWSARLGDTNMLLSSDLTDRSRILFRRNIRERVRTLAPFLNWDNDPYLVVDSGRLVWIMDAYTVTDRYPYSKPTAMGIAEADVVQVLNYMRNSVKAVVDAYDGTVTFYAMDPNDPILATWQRIFPGLFTPMAQMPAGLRAHLRYPEDLFRTQRDIYTLYHISDPAGYYNKQDAWDVPADPTPPTDSQGNQVASQGRPMTPYYVVMRLPGEKNEEFLMFTPFTPRARDNISAWMCAKCDPDDYGQLLVYRFPRGKTVYGPQQVIGLIKRQYDVSQFQTLVGQRGSKIIYGNLLAIPIESSLLYAIPIYIQASDPGAAAIPQLSRVVVASGEQIVMRTTLEAAIAALSSSQAPPATTASTGPVGPAPPNAHPTPSSAPATVPELVQRARSAYDNARKKQAEYGQALDDLGRALDALQRQLGPGK